MDISDMVLQIRIRSDPHHFLLEPEWSSQQLGFGLTLVVADTKIIKQLCKKMYYRQKNLPHINMHIENELFDFYNNVNSH